VSALAPILEAFFTDRLMTQRHASPHTVAAYRDTFKLLLGFIWRNTGVHPTRLDLSDLDAPTIGAFLHHLEAGRGNSVTTRNARLAAVHSLFRYAAFLAPEHAALIQRVLAIPAKRHDRSIIDYLTHDEVDALVAAPDRSRWTGRRDHVLLLTATQTGLRVSELTALTRQDIHLGTGPHARCTGKGRKERCTPLTAQTVNALRVWLAERAGRDTDPLFPSSRGRPLSRDAIERLVNKHTASSDSGVFDTARQERLPARPAPLRRDGTAPRRRRHLGDRALAGSRVHRHHPDLPTRRHDAQGTSSRPDHAGRNHPRTLPRPRRAACLPRCPLTTPAVMPRTRY
jgi:integrase/recombinase XerD